MTPDQIIIEALNRYERPLIGYAKEITGDLEAARDSVQETFLRLSKQDVIALQERLAPWLFLVCRNCALDHVRKIIRFNPNPDAEIETIPSRAPTPVESLMGAEDKEALLRSVSRLPLQQRELIRLKFEAGMSYKEMSETLKISISNVGVQLHEAIKTLRKQWGSNQNQEIPAAI